MAGLRTVHSTVCQVCHNCCPIEVAVEAGRAVEIHGNKNNRHYAGFSCGKGRRQLAYHYSTDRLLHSQKRLPSGELVPISSAQVMDEVAERLQGLLDEHGPRAIALYFGTQAFQTAGSSMPVIKGFLNALGTPMVFDSVTIDQPGKMVARALHGSWLAPAHTADEAEVLLLFGANPLVSMLGLPSGNPGTWLNRRLEEGARLIVVDPRRTETARRAELFLQVRPGHDVAILAAMLRVILAEDLGDRQFRASWVDGIDRLRAAVAPFTPAAVARTAGIDADDLVRAARMYGAARKGFVDAGTGPNMAQSGSTLEYLIAVLRSVCGHVRRAGEEVPDPLTLYPALPAIAQPMPPAPATGFGERLRVRNLTSCPAGLPVSALADEILLDGEGQVRALFSVGGNPVVAWPDQVRTTAAMKALNLLVQVDPFLSNTAQFADYVIAPRMPLEVPHVTQILDFLQALGIGPGAPYAQYGPAVLDVPEGSDLLSEWEFFYGLAQRLNLSIEVPHPFGMVDPIPLDMSQPPTEEELLDLVCAGSRIPLEVVRQYRDGLEGEAAAEPRVVVAPADPACTAKLDAANPEMMADLATIAASLGTADEGFVLVGRRETHAANSSYNAKAARGIRRHNPAYLNPVDAERLGVRDDDLVRIASARAAVVAVVSVDDSMRPGVVALSHAYGPAEADVDDPWGAGASTARLADVEDDYDRYSGQPRMSGIPVVLSAVRQPAAVGG